MSAASAAALLAPLLLALALGQPRAASAQVVLPPGGLAPPAGGTAAAAGAAESRLWFDPTQLPSFTGTVARYLMDPDGRVGRLLFREGPQVIFPEHIAEEVRRGVEPGRRIVVWGIRARTAPVITMLAWAPYGGGEGAGQPRFVDRPTWGFGEFEAAGDPMQVAGTVEAPLYTPQGEVIGAILTDAILVRVPRAAGAALGERLSAGRRLAATGRGRTGPLGMALDAEAIGESGDALRPVADYLPGAAPPGTPAAATPAAPGAAAERRP